MDQDGTGHGDFGRERRGPNNDHGDYLYFGAGWNISYDHLFFDHGPDGDRRVFGHSAAGPATRKHLNARYARRRPGAEPGICGRGRGLAEGSGARKTAAEIEKEVQEFVEQRLLPGPRVEVRVTSEGILMSVSDAANFGMFAVGSAEPRPELVVVMEKIADILRPRRGRIVVRGHTDNRLYKSKNYDNWRLSSARAHMAHYMLARGGIEPERIERIEGHADQMPRNQQDAAAAENRRIEILLKVDHL